MVFNTIFNLYFMFTELNINLQDLYIFRYFVRDLKNNNPDQIK